MNPYEATLGNVLARVGAWVRGCLHRYRKPLLVMVAATATLAVGVSAGNPPAGVDVAGAQIASAAHSTSGGLFSR